MKTSLQIFLYLIIFIPTIQSQDFASAGAEWYFDTRNPSAPAWAGDPYYHYKNIGDTVLLEKIAHIIERQPIAYNTVYNSIDTLQSSFEYVYQKGDTVYAYSSGKKKFLKMLTFNLKKGDSLIIETGQGNRAIIDSVKIELLQGKMLKKYFATTDRKISFVYMDEIGSLTGFVPLIGPGFIMEHSETIRCFRNAHLDIAFTGKNCDQVLSALEHNKDYQPIKLHPNPTSASVSILEMKLFKMLEVFDSQGCKVLTSNQPNFSLELFPSGLYFLKAYGDHIYSGKIVKY